MAYAIPLLFIALLTYKVRQVYAAMRSDYDKKSRAQTQALSASEVEVEIEQLTERYNRQARRKFTLIYAGLALISFAAAFLNKSAESAGPETYDINLVIFISAVAVSVYVLKADLSQDGSGQIKPIDLRGAGVMIMNVILRIVLFFVTCNLFGGIHDTVRYGYLKSVRAIERPSQIQRSDVGVDYYLINTPQSPKSGITLYDYYSYRGLEVTVLHPMHDAQGEEAVFLTKKYQVLNSDRPLDQINQDIQSDLSAYMDHKVCLSHALRHSTPRAIHKILKRPDVHHTLEDIVILEPTRGANFTVLDDQGASRPNAIRSDISACEEITTQDTITHLINLSVFVALIVWLYRQILMCREVGLAHFKFHES